MPTFGDKLLGEFVVSEEALEAALKDPSGFIERTGEVKAPVSIPPELAQGYIECLKLGSNVPRGEALIAISTCFEQKKL